MEFVEFEKITLFDGVEIDFEDPSYLMCSLSVDVSNPDLAYLGSEFELRMVVNNEMDDLDKNRFIFKVESEDETTHVYKTFALDSGKNTGSSVCLNQILWDERFRTDTKLWIFKIKIWKLCGDYFIKFGIFRSNFEN